MLTFPWDFCGREPVPFTLSLLPPKAPASELIDIAEDGNGFRIHSGNRAISVQPNRVEVSGAPGSAWFAELLAPERKSQKACKMEVIERGCHYLWARLLVPDVQWPRIVEVRADSLGTLAVRVHLQRAAAEDGFAPDLGWRIQQGELKDPMAEVQGYSVGSAIALLPFETGEEFSTPFAGGTLALPEAPQLRRGSVEIESWPAGTLVTYYRCHETEKVPHQPMAWREAAFVIAGPGQPAWNALDEPPHKTVIESDAFDSIYGSGSPADYALYPELAQMEAYHREAIVSSALAGDDAGNVTNHNDGGPASVYGMNRLNHCPPIFEEWHRTGDQRLRATAVGWCFNFHDLSIWWGKEPTFGGTRYNNATAAGQKEHTGDTSFMWRTNFASHFCTKGFDSFFYAYEETGDPRMMVALQSQLAYAKEHIHAVMPPGEPRNIGDVMDFLRLLRFTGIRDYEEEALRLFRDIRKCLTPEDLFTQSSDPIEPDPPFIDDDAVGLKHPFVKPYIVGYALAGLPALAGLHPEEDRLAGTVRAVAHFQAGAQDPCGGWRYPHPRSSYVIVSHALENANQICNAIPFLESRGEPTGRLLGAVERTLQNRILVWRRSGKILTNLTAWEKATGVIKDGSTLYDLYKKPEDRDGTQDYSEGAISLGSCPPEGLVYFSPVLSFYLKHRPVERLFHPGPELSTILTRLPARQMESQSLPAGEFERYGIRQDLPVFFKARLEDMKYPACFDPRSTRDFEQWRSDARKILLESYLAPPPQAPFAPVVAATDDRGSYTARKIALNISSYERIPAYLLVPKGKGPFPAVVALHDHGAHFSIGKEKLVRPFEEPAERIEDASQWVSQLYGGRYIGDELAKRGYVVFAMDALYWGDRGRAEGVSYEGQQALAANLLQLGMSWAGLIAWDDLCSVEFVASLPEVDPDRIGAIGLSVGASRTWHLAAGTDRIKAGAAICWMADTQGLMVPGNNQTKGQSANSLLHPGLRNLLDYPHVASIACPKPMLFFAGEEDGLFPVPSVERAFAEMRKVWECQGAGDRLITQIWPVPHVFNREMQDEAFGFLDRYLKD
jgi:dienelactone hydrolase